MISWSIIINLEIQKIVNTYLCDHVSLSASTTWVIINSIAISIRLPIGLHLSYCGTKYIRLIVGTLDVLLLPLNGPSEQNSNPFIWIWITFERCLNVTCGIWFGPPCAVSRWTCGARCTVWACPAAVCASGGSRWRAAALRAPLPQSSS